MFLWLAVAVLIWMTSRLLRWPRGRTRRATESAQEAALAEPPALTDHESGAPLSPPEDHFRRLRPRASAPPVAAIAARTLPVLGIVGTVLTLLLAIGVVRGELPYFEVTRRVRSDAG